MIPKKRGDTKLKNVSGIFQSRSSHLYLKKRKGNFTVINYGNTEMKVKNLPVSPLIIIGIYIWFSKIT